MFAMVHPPRESYPVGSRGMLPVRRDEGAESEMSGDKRADTRLLVGLAIGSIGAIAVAIALVPFRSEIDNANLGLILVLVVMCAAVVGGRMAGAVGAVI